jgi:hypothetical protein
MATWLPNKTALCKFYYTERGCSHQDCTHAHGLSDLLDGYFKSANESEKARACDKFYERHGFYPGDRASKAVEVPRVKPWTKPMTKTWTKPTTKPEPLEVYQATVEDFPLLPTSQVQQVHELTKKELSERQLVQVMNDRAKTWEQMIELQELLRKQNHEIDELEKQLKPKEVMKMIHVKTPMNEDGNGWEHAPCEYYSHEGSVHEESVHMCRVHTA